MLYYFIINEQIHKYIIEYVNSICKKIYNSKIINYPKEQINNIEKDNIYIFVGIHYVSYPLIDLPNIYYLNLEQLTINGLNSNKNLLKDVINLRTNTKELKLLDYSTSNISILDGYNIKSEYIPYQVNYDEIYNYEKENDFVLCCTVNERKLNIFNELNKLYPKSKFIGDPPLWGNLRDEYLFKSKLLINIHHQEKEYNILEEIRITRCILNKIIIISEPSVHSGKYPLNTFIIYEKYDNIIKKTKDILENYDFYYNKIYNNFDIVNINLQLKKYLSVLPNFINIDKLNGYSDIFNNQKIYFNDYIVKNNISNIFNTFRTNHELYGCLDMNVEKPNQEAILLADKINSDIFGKYLICNLKQKIIGYGDKDFEYSKLSNIDIQYILFSIILFSKLKELKNDNFNKIIEIGGGFGNLLRINHNIQNFNKWIIIDYLHYNLLQEFYLSFQDIPKNKYILVSDNVVKINEEIDIIISIFYLSMFSLHEFNNYYDNIIKKTKYFYYVFNYNYPSIDLNNIKNNIISKDFELIDNKNVLNSIHCCLFINKNKIN
jgi:hypothetical protein